MSEGLTAVVHQAQVTKALRNILANELGVSSASVAIEVQKAIDAAVEKHIARVLQQDEVKLLVIKYLNRYLAGGGSYGTPDKLETMMKEAIKAEAVRVVSENVRVTVSAGAKP